MCTNYAPVQRRILREIFGVEPPAAVYKAETYPDYAAPIVRADDDGRRRADLASFGMVPRQRIPPGARRYDTTNARSETVGERPAFARYWRQGQLCLIPATAFYEFAYRDHAADGAAPGKPVRWRVWLPGEPALGIAGLWRGWPDQALSFTMLTVSSAQHPLLRRFHKPGDEKRSVVIVPRAQWDDWLACRDPEVARTFLKLLPADVLQAEPAPKVQGAPIPDAD
ncbi:SOS response-associated peptidase [Cupriavidus sp. MP-37]|uniref:SOS response-associated peptidase n=1 Tax=Cupriavidus sp. MP-37 TaxID=2884455 RepID=UPI001D09CB0A|nr:SOS response-associated peptidase family protein [Cupriavidus sp. MP-37]UDM53443.1 SOS response-associated peptidase family protein [Cupriavidus sp. MP-37]